MDIKAIIDGIDTPEIAKDRRVEGDAVIFDMGAYDLKVLIEESEEWGCDTLTDSLGVTRKRICRTLFVMCVHCDNKQWADYLGATHANEQIEEEIERMHETLGGCAAKNHVVTAQADYAEAMTA